MCSETGHIRLALSRRASRGLSEFMDSFPRSATKQEVRRAKLKRLGNEHAWDREHHLGRLSGQDIEGQSH
jgi:hypothetical protein